MEKIIELHFLNKLIDIGSKKGEFIPMVHLLEMTMNDIYGSDHKEYMSGKYEFVNGNGEGFGLITNYFDSRIGFTFQLEGGWKEFIISVDGARLKINQIQLFDKIREWGFEV